MKRFLLLAIPFFMGLLLVAQTTTAYAHDNDKDKKTPPITNPVPVTYFKLGGTVSYMFHNKLFTLPNVKVKATDKKTHQTFSATTNANGVYEFSALQKDTYVVSPQDTKNIEFNDKTVDLNTNKLDVDFKGHKDH